MNIFEQQKERDERIKQSMSKIKHLIVVGSGKGGVGKSTIAANFAISLAKLGYKVGLADVDIYGPSIPTLFNIENQEVLGQEIDGKVFFMPFEKFGIKLMSVGFFVDNTISFSIKFYYMPHMHSRWILHFIISFMYRICS